MADNSDREQRTHEATPRRRDEARERGQVPISSELMSAVGLVAGITALSIGGAQLMSTTALQLTKGLGLVAQGRTLDFGVPASAALVEQSIMGVIGSLSLIVVPTVLLGALTGFAQIGLNLAPKALEVDPSKLDPIKGMGKLFSMRGVARTSLSLAKVLLIMTVATTVTWMHIGKVAHFGPNELGPLMAAAGVVVLRVAASVLAVVLALAVIDLLFQRFNHDRDLRMTQAEVKEEQRLTDGDPHLRARIRAVQREFAMRRMMDDVPKATVVITNPTHYAVALRYERDLSSDEKRAPTVVAKGIDKLAERIKDVARENGVVCTENVPLARALHARVAIGQEIPEELYEAVAAVLATVFRMQEAHAS